MLIGIEPFFSLGLNHRDGDGIDDIGNPTATAGIVYRFLSPRRIGPMAVALMGRWMAL